MNHQKDYFAGLSELSDQQLEHFLALGRLHPEWLHICKKLFEEYDAAFGNFEDLARPEILLEDRLLDLLRAALRRGHALTVDEVEATFPAKWF